MAAPAEPLVEPERLQRPLLAPYGDARTENETTQQEQLVKFHQNLSALAGGLGLGSEKDVTDFLKSNNFRPFFDVFYKECVEPERAKRPGNKLPTAACFDQVVHALKIGEAGGLQKYSKTFPDKSDWEIIDYQASFLYHCTRHNANNFEGLLFDKRKDWSQDKLYHAIFQCLRYQMSKKTPHHLKRAEERAGKANVQTRSQIGQRELGFDLRGIISPSPTAESASDVLESIETEVKIEEQSEREQRTLPGLVQVSPVSATPTRPPLRPFTSGTSASGTGLTNRASRLSISRPGASLIFASPSSPTQAFLPRDSPKGDASDDGDQEAESLFLPSAQDTPGGRVVPFPQGQSFQQAQPSISDRVVTPGSNASSVAGFGASFLKKRPGQGAPSPTRAPKRLSVSVDQEENATVADASGSVPSPRPPIPPPHDVIDLTISDDDEAAGVDTPTALIKDEEEEGQEPVERTPFQIMRDEWPPGSDFSPEFRYCRLIAIHIAIKSREEALPTWLREHVRAAAAGEFDEDTRLNAQSSNWFKETQGIIDNNLIAAGPPTDDDIQAFLAEERFLNTKPSITFDKDQVYDQLNMVGGTMPRIQGMRIGKHLTDLQMLGIYAITQMRETLTGAMLADATGLGKTLQMLGVILQVSAALLSTCQ